MTTWSTGLFSLTSWLLATYFAVAATYLNHDGGQYRSLVICFGVLAGALAIPGLIYGFALYRLKDREFELAQVSEPTVPRTKGRIEDPPRA